MKSYIKLLVSLSSLVICSLAFSAEPLLMPAWQSDTVFEQPESVVLNADRQSFFVSNVNGDPNETDGNGYISQMSLTGEIIEQHWLDGFDAPKGLAVVGNNLYVADIKQLVVVDIKNKKITQRYLAPYAKFLNDVAVDNDGNVYVSDMMTNTIHRLMHGSFNVWLRNEQLEAPNGLLVEDDQLIVASWGNMTDGIVTAIPGHLKTIDIKTKNISSLGDQTPVGNLDGVEPDGNGNYYVTDWVGGRLIHIQPSGISKTLLKLAQGSADHTVLLDQGLVIIPMMLSGNVVAYKISR
jgi:DNA-binding beta-propeller fold protein YncE